MKAIFAPSSFLSRPSRPGDGIPLAIGLFLSYYLAAEAAFTIGTLTHRFAPFWPPNVVLLCALLVVPQRQWWICILAVLPAHLAAELRSAVPPLLAIAAFVDNCIVAILGAAALRHVSGGPPWLDNRRKTTAYLLITAIAAPALAALSAATEPVLVGGDLARYWGFWWRWYLANALGALTLAPVFLTWLDEAGERSAIPARSRVEAGALSLLLIATCILAFGLPGEASGSFLPARLYAPVAPLLWAVVRFGIKGASRAVFGVTLLAIWCAMTGRGPFAEHAPGEDVLPLQLFLAVVSAPILLLGALVKESHRTSHRLGTILAGITDCYIAFDHGWRVTTINPQASLWFDAPRGDADTGVISRDFPMARLIDAFERRTPLHIEHQSAIRPGRWLELHVYPSADGLSVFFRDITNRKTAEIEARETHELLQSTMDALSAPVVILDEDFNIVAVNAAWQRFAAASGYAGAHYGVGGGYREVFGSLCPDCTEESRIAEGLLGVLTGAYEEFRLAYSCRMRSETRWFQLRLTCFRRGPVLRIVAAHEDITEVKHAERALEDLTGRLLQAQDDERRRIARELHDSTVQNLLGIAFNLASLPRLVPSLGDKAKALLAECRTLLDQSQQEVRTFSYLLHPPVLSEAGLPVAVKSYVDGFARRSGIAVSVEIAPSLGRLPDEVEIALYRVVQEALANVARHSGSATASLKLHGDETGEAAGTHVVLVIADAGTGMTGSQPGRLLTGPRLDAIEATGVGIAGMRQRIRQLGGQLQIVSSIAGTTITAVVPVFLAKRTAADPV